MKNLFTLLFILLLNVSFAQVITGKVVRVKDGDTIVVLDSNKEQHTIRVADIDCPEKSQPYGKKAKWFVSDEVFGKIVKVDVTKKDRYGRSIGNVFYDGKNLSVELLKNGYAWHYKKYSKNKFYQSLEDNARKNKIGLFKDPNAIPPYEYRKGKRKQKKKSSFKEIISKFFNSLE